LAKYRPSVPVETKRALLEETNYKCANPGCPSTLLELHHIKEWAVYRSHDKTNMIAICPNCHQTYHRSALGISDQVLYRWKGFERKKRDKVDRLYVEPAERFQLVLGTVGLGPRSIRAFELANGGSLSVKLVHDQLFFVNLLLPDSNGKPLLRIVDNSVIFYEEGSVTYESRPGRFLLTAGEAFVPEWCLKILREKDSTFAVNGRVVLLDLSVDAPGEVTCNGFWLNELEAIAATPQGIIFVRYPDKVYGLRNFSVDYKGPVGPDLISNLEQRSFFRFV
jgi:hypothetical protein